MVQSCSMARELLQEIRTKTSLHHQTHKAEKQGLLTNAQREAFLSESQNFFESVTREFSSEDQKRIFSALRLMTTLHIPQKERPDHTAYISHPLNVATALLENMQKKDADTIVAALLHDTVEDQGASLAKMWNIRNRRSQILSEREEALSEIQAQYGSRVRSIVEAVSNPNFNEEVREEVAKEGIIIEENSLEFKKRKVRHYQEHFLRIIHNKDAFLVKLADFSSNVLSIDDVADAKQRAKYIGKYGPLIPAVLTKLTDDSLNLKPEVRENLSRQFTQAWERMDQPILN